MDKKDKPFKPMRKSAKSMRKLAKSMQKSVKSMEKSVKSMNETITRPDKNTKFGKLTYLIKVLRRLIPKEDYESLNQAILDWSPETVHYLVIIFLLIMFLKLVFVFKSNRNV